MKVSTAHPPAGGGPPHAIRSRAPEAASFGRLLERLAHASDGSSAPPAGGPGVCIAAEAPAEGPAAGAASRPAVGLAAADVRGAVAWMARAASLAAAASGRLALVLRDPRLGTLHLQVAVRGRRVRVRLRGGGPGVRETLLGGRSRLAADLSSRGLSLDTFD